MRGAEKRQRTGDEMSGLFTLRSRIAGAARRSAPAYVLAVMLGALVGRFACSDTLAAAPPDPSVRLYDTGYQALSVTSLGRALTEKRGWTLIEGGAVDPKRATGLVMINNSVALVVSRHGEGVCVYRRAPEGFRQRVLLMPLPSVVEFAEFRAIQNNEAAVELEAKCHTARGELFCRFRLTAGEPVVQIRPGNGMKELILWGLDKLRGCVLVPQFFGDDAAFAHPRVGDRPIRLPAENFLVQLPDPLASMLVCAWESAEQSADLFAPKSGQDPQPAVLSIQCAEDKRIWVSCLAFDELWWASHHVVVPNHRPAAVLRNFKPPFPAKWRASFVGKDGVCESITFEQPPEKAPVPEDWRGPVIIYPIDRSRETPLATILPMDILRSTLGVGPCQYILDAEGLGGDDPAPPDAVLAWIERLVKKKRAARLAEEIGERLDAMLTHLAAARQRIDDYAAFGRQVRHVCREAAKKDAEKEAAEAILGICDRLDHDLARGRKGMGTPDEAAKLTREIAALIEKPEALAAFEKPAKALRAIGHAFDATLARSRMAARRMKAYCRGAKNDLARTVETMADRMLRPRK